jgi:hypothetical protein
VNRKKESLRSPRRILGAREPGKRGLVVAKEGFCARPREKSPIAVTKQVVMCPPRSKNSNSGHKTSSYVPANNKKHAQRSQNKQLCARQHKKSPTAVTKQAVLCPPTTKISNNRNKKFILAQTNPK